MYIVIETLNEDTCCTVGNFGARVGARDYETMHQLKNIYQRYDEALEAARSWTYKNLGKTCHIYTLYEDVRCTPELTQVKN
jgi:hypothetical protein